VLFTWPLAIAGLFLPPVMGVPAKVPGTEVLFGLLLAAYAMQWWFALVLGEMATTLVQSRCLPRRLVMFA
jgi:hypothetical protein